MMQQLKREVAQRVAELQARFDGRGFTGSDDWDHLSDCERRCLRSPRRVLRRW